MRTWAPFGNGWVAFYCHGYKQPGEHYHPNYEELVDCPYPENAPESLIAPRSDTIDPPVVSEAT